MSMTFLFKNKRTGFLLAGAGMGLVLLTGGLGWRMAQPSARLNVLPETNQSQSKAKKPLTAEQATGELISSKHSPASYAQQNVAEAPASIARTPAPSPKPVAQEALPPAFKTAVEKVTPVDPSLPENSLVIQGQQVFVQQMLTGGAIPGMALDVVVTPVAQPDEATQITPDVAQEQVTRTRLGFTYEQELFRSKWGWAAYDAANRAATWELQKSTPASR